MNAELKSEIIALVELDPQLAVLPFDQAVSVASAVRLRNVEDARATWWWQALRVPAIELAYGEADGLAMLAGLVPPGARVVLAVTDDEPAPWMMVEGPIGGVIALLAELRFFEYWIAAPDGAWMVFDTHHNTLIAVGSVVGAGSAGPVEGPPS